MESLKNAFFNDKASVCLPINCNCYIVLRPTLNLEMSYWMHGVVSFLR